MSYKIIDLIHTENEEIFYYFLNIVPYSKAFPEINKFYNIFKKNPSIIDNTDKIPKIIMKNQSIMLFLKFYNAIFYNQNNKAILYLENFINNGLYDEFYLLSILYGIKENLEIESYFELDDQYYSILIKSYYYVKHNDFDKAFSLLAEINSINRLNYLKELIYLQCAIEKGLYNEAENIFSLLYKLNKNNEALKKLYAYYLLRKGEIIASFKYLEQKKIKLNNDKEKTLYLYNLIESRQFDKAISYLKKEAKTEEKLFLLARLLHYIGILDEAFEIYEKIDEIKFPVNKMKGLIYFQLGKIDEALNSFNKEITVRFAETDLIKLIRYLEMKKRWSNASNSFRINI